MKRIYLGLGSNLGDREAHLRAAVAAMPPAGIEVLRVSPVYETEPVDYTDQPSFLNLVVEAQTRLFPRQLLARTARIERDLGRIRTIPKGPRTADIDILFYAGAVIRTPDLEVPHPRLAARRFVLAPLADLAPALRHPVTRQTIEELLAAAPAQKIVKTPIRL